MPHVRECHEIIESLGDFIPQEAREQLAPIFSDVGCQTNFGPPTTVGCRLRNPPSMEVIRVMNAHWDNRSVSPHLAAETPTSVPDELKTPTTSRVPPTTSVSLHLAAETPTSVPDELKTPTTSVSPHMAATQPSVSPPSVSPLSAAQRVPPTTSDTTPSVADPTRLRRVSSVFSTSSLSGDDGYYYLNAEEPTVDNETQQMVIIEAQEVKDEEEDVPTLEEVHAVPPTTLSPVSPTQTVQQTPTLGEVDMSESGSESGDEADPQTLEEDETPRKRKRKQRVVIVPEKERKVTPKRYKKWCPLPGCRSKPQVKISQHLKNMHPELTHSDRMTALRNARRYLGGSSGPVQKPGQTAMDSFLDRQEESSFEEELPVAPKTPVIVPTGRTTQLLRYDVETEQTLLDFRGWLQTVDG
ncbi:mucin-2-like isoform X2 [Halichondria panicea]|uniref:mucin-2-like isoform X2 n=1 Tax=Halichondria panicea TaxID=6063 RepID=UPI00312BBE9D